MRTTTPATTQRVGSKISFTGATGIVIAPVLRWTTRVVTHQPRSTRRAVRIAARAAILPAGLLLYSQFVIIALGIWGGIVIWYAIIFMPPLGMFTIPYKLHMRQVRKGNIQRQQLVELQQKGTTP